jgi:ABC-type bacteriocin/lantibiotic exporter with double-glycine peptidase domain
MVDKSTASMDGRSEQVFLELLSKLRSMCTIVIVTQWPYLLEQCDKVYELKGGNFVPVKAMPARGEAVS